MPKNKRPPDKEEKTICMGLKKNLLEPSLLPWIQETVDNVSRRTHRASLLINHYVLEHINDPGFDDIIKGVTDQMFLYTALSLGSGKKYKQLIQFFTANKELYESIPDLPMGGRVINSTARLMKTNVNNYLWMTFEKRLERLCSKQDCDAKRYVLSRARNWTPYREVVLNENESRVLDMCTRTLLTTKPVTDKWIIDNPGPVLRLYHQILRFCEENGKKAFPTLPIFQMKSHFITIDATLMRDLLGRAGLIEENMEEEVFNSLQNQHFRSVFKVRGSWELGNEVKTDGVSLRVNVWRTREGGEAPPKPKKRAFTTELEVPSTDTLLPSDDDDYFSNDPGQSNQAFVHHTISGQVVRKARLTYKKFCVESHHSSNKKKQVRWLQEIQDDLTELSTTPARTSSADVFKDYLKAKVPMYDRLWRNGTNPRAAKARWDYQIHSKSCIDRFWSGLAYDHPAGLPLHQRPLLKYGSANWGHGGAPNKRMLASARKFFRVILVPEFNTTVCCATCGERMRSVKQLYVGPMEEGKKRYPRTIRGLKHCSSNVCRSTPLKSRDGNAAANIGYAFPNRPEYLCPHPRQN